MKYEDKTNKELTDILNEISKEKDKVEKEVEKLLLVVDSFEMRYMYIEDLIKKRMKK